jgi:spore maturation protein CgeB
MANDARLKLVFLGLSITSSWGNGHATTYRGLLTALARRGHEVTFLERDTPWYASKRDLHSHTGVRIELYDSLSDLRRLFSELVRGADMTVVGSYVPEGRDVGDWVADHADGRIAFYDIDTPITAAALETDACEYLGREQLSRYDLYFSFTGGPVLDRLIRLGARAAVPLYCAADASEYRPVDLRPEWDLGYLGTYAPDRQPALETCLLDVARQWPEGRFVVAGPLYPSHISWPANVTRLEHVPPGEHCAFYGRQRATLNLTRSDMRRLGYSPSVRLFEAAACGTAILTDDWEGLETFFTRGYEVMPVHSTETVLSMLRNRASDRLSQLGARARRRVLADHTADHRARSFEEAVRALSGQLRKAVNT